MANPPTPVATSTSHPHPHCQWSPLPSEIEDHFQLMEQQLHGLALTLYRLQKLCPLVQSTPHVRALATKMEFMGGMMRDAVREMHDKMSIPFQVSQPTFQDEEWQKSQVELRSSNSGDMSQLDRTPDADTTTTTTTTKRTTASTRFRGDIPHVPRVVRRHGPDDLAKTLPYSLQVRDVPGSTFTSWHVPYKVVFTPDEKMLDVDGNPLPAILIDVDEKGTVKYVWKNGSLDKDKDKVEYVDEEPCIVPPKQDLRTGMVRRVTLVPPQRISAGKLRDGQVEGRPGYITSGDIYAMGGRIMRDFLQATQAQATAAAAAGKKRKRGAVDATEIESAAPETKKRQRTNSC